MKPAMINCFILYIYTGKKVLGGEAFPETEKGVVEVGFNWPRIKWLDGSVHSWSAGKTYHNSYNKRRLRKITNPSICTTTKIK